MEKNVAKAKVIKTRKGYAINVEGRDHYIPKECDPIINSQLEVLVGQEAEVLIAGREILAIRVQKELAKELKIKPIITCYLVPLEIAFAPEIMERVAPTVTKLLVESGYLDEEIAMTLQKWQRVR